MPMKDLHLRIINSMEEWLILKAAIVEKALSVIRPSSMPTKRKDITRGLSETETV